MWIKEKPRRNEKNDAKNFRGNRKMIRTDFLFALSMKRK